MKNNNVGLLEHFDADFDGDGMPEQFVVTDATTGREHPSFNVPSLPAATREHFASLVGKQVVYQTEEREGELFVTGVEAAEVAV